MAHKVRELGESLVLRVTGPVDVCRFAPGVAPSLGAGLRAAQAAVRRSSGVADARGRGQTVPAGDVARLWSLKSARAPPWELCSDPARRPWPWATLRRGTLLRDARTRRCHLGWSAGRSGVPRVFCANPEEACGGRAATAGLSPGRVPAGSPGPRTSTHGVPPGTAGSPPGPGAENGAALHVFGTGAACTLECLEV